LPNLQKNVYQAFDSAFNSIRVDFSMGWSNWNKWTIFDPPISTGTEYTMEVYAAVETATQYTGAFEEVFSDDI
jgi:hypothetical protein